ncbi:hypothetical protein AWW66_01105 [Micromonospora rosaria]|uniref:Uncharacterized protein n=1 Tax=Micromonospora rosaria TaxID=47874 RepID=A0A136PZD8_9ACTN|nr:nucleotide disphospho-sugar-binding domain-containing protein [Micromonospora rosaria]KXK63809.1 hypothetical protein AWW66_01105 [Micromonospora rosaria]
MRVLVTTPPGLGHSLSLIPVAWALRAAGHDVLVATSGSSVRAVGHAGLPVLDGYPDGDIAEVFTLHEQRAAETGFELSRFVGGLFGDLTDRIADRVVAAARAWRPDLVIRSSLEEAGSVAAAVLGVPVVCYHFGLPVPVALREATRAAARVTAERHGVSEWPVRPARVLDPMPASLLDEGMELDQPIRFIPYSGDDAPRPGWMLKPPVDRPRVCVTLGTEVPRWAGLDVVEEVVAAAADVDVELLLALGGAPVDSLGPLPPNVRAFSWFPIADVAATCAGIVHHGGAATVLTACANGIPQVVVPHGGDQFLVAPLLAKRGLAVVLETGGVDRDSAAAALRRLVGDAALRAAAGEVRDEMAAAPAPTDLVDLLVGVARA